MWTRADTVLEPTVYMRQPIHIQNVVAIFMKITEQNFVNTIIFIKFLYKSRHIHTFTFDHLPYLCKIVHWPPIAPSGLLLLPIL